MKTYTSETGYILCNDGNAYEAKTIYLGKFDKAENYKDIIKEEYEQWLAKQKSSNSESMN